MTEPKDLREKRARYDAACRKRDEAEGKLRAAHANWSNVVADWKARAEVAEEAREEWKAADEAFHTRWLTEAS